jgi:tRNA(Ile2) C34 agmatinyltransferase TiaS
MANLVPVGSDVSAGTYRCTKCGNELQVDSTKLCRRALSVGTVSTRR